MIDPDTPTQATNRKTGSGVNHARGCAIPATNARRLTSPASGSVLDVDRREDRRVYESRMFHLLSDRVSLIDVQIETAGSRIRPRYGSTC